MPAPLNANELRLSMPTCLLHAPLRERRPLALAVAYTNVYGGCIAMVFSLCCYSFYYVANG